MSNVAQLKFPKPKNIRYYNRNPNLKGIGVQTDYTLDQMKEYKKCADDPIYFIRTYCRIVHVDRGVIPFALYPYQEKFVINLHNHRMNVACFPRQSGKCLVSDTKLTVRNKLTGEILEVTAEEFHDLSKKR